jgi:hypothetical protein
MRHYFRQYFFNTLTILNLSILIFLYCKYDTIHEGYKTVSSTQLSLNEKLSDYTESNNTSLKNLSARIDSIQHQISRIEFESRGYTQPESSIRIEVIPADDPEPAYNSDIPTQSGYYDPADSDLCNAFNNGSLLIPVFGLSGILDKKCN